ncbi:MAG: ABC transporter substrate-binding protein [Oscillospiraceae bacterium]|jgi:peptide/nickel transport system substrate-binding protein|nr:ABC transporter substrate-binding protein [Oscillospiraceae bacterium]
MQKQKYGKRFIALLLCCALLFAFSACDGGKSESPASSDGTGSGSEADGTPDQSGNQGGDNEQDAGAPQVGSARDTLNIAVTGDGGTLNYIKMMGGFVNVARMFAEPLFDNDANMEKVWRLATDIEEVSTSQWIIHLREGVKFSNGNPFTAADVMFTLNYLKNDPMGFMYIPTFDLENSKILDDYTIDLAIVGYQITQMDALTMLYFFDEESFDADSYALNPVGTGPYVVTDYVINSHVSMTANGNYWGEAPRIKNLQFKVLNEDTQRINALQAGTVDVSGIPISEIGYVSGLPDFKVDTIMTGLCNNIVFNLSDNSVFKSLDARLAVSHAIDRDAIVSLVYDGHAAVTDYPVSMSAKDFEPRFANMHESYSVGHDVELARQYAEKAGIVGQTVKIVTNGSSDYITIAEIVQANLKDIGVMAEINNYDAASYYDVSNDPTMFDMSIYATASPQKLVVGMLYSYVLYTPVLMDNEWEGKARFLALGEEVLANPDVQARSDSVYEMVRIFVDADLWYGICDTENAVAYNSKLQGVKFWSSGDFRYDEWYWTE